jgi:GDP-4-dehydro-6-deoxy-D-mannose reductase
MRTLVTGATGFVGGHLAEALLAREDPELFGFSRRGEWPASWSHLAGRVALEACDLCAGADVEGRLRRIRPDRIYHLAGYAQVGQSFREVEAAWAGNLTATRGLYDAIERWGGRPRIVYVSSGLVYGDADGSDQAFSETCLLRPTSPYAASKAAADLASYQYSRSPGLDIVRVRPFNHIGPHQSPQFAVAHFAKQIAAIETGRQPPVLETGNLSPVRDLTDVRDVVRAYLLLAEGGRTGDVYNVATGQALSMEAVLDRLLSLARVPIQVRTQARLVRAVEVAAVRGDAGKLRRQTGWTPRYSLNQTLTDTLEFWRHQS